MSVEHLHRPGPHAGSAASRTPRPCSRRPRRGWPATSGRCAATAFRSETSPSCASAASTRECGYAAMQSLLKEKERPTAVFIASDTVAIGSLRAIAERGSSRPAGYRRVRLRRHRGFPFTSPPLSTVSFAVERARPAVRRDPVRADERESRAALPRDHPVPDRLRASSVVTGRRATALVTGDRSQFVELEGQTVRGGVSHETLDVLFLLPLLVAGFLVTDRERSRPRPSQKRCRSSPPGVETRRRDSARSWMPSPRQSGVAYSYEGNRDSTVVLKSRVAANNAPDIAFVPRPGEVAAYARRGLDRPAEPGTGG